MLVLKGASRGFGLKLALSKILREIASSFSLISADPCLLLEFAVFEEGSYVV